MADAAPPPKWQGGCFVVERWPDLGAAGLLLQLTARLRAAGWRALFNLRSLLHKWCARPLAAAGGGTDWRGHAASFAEDKLCIPADVFTNELLCSGILTVDLVVPIAMNLYQRAVEHAANPSSHPAAHGGSVYFRLSSWLKLGRQDAVASSSRRF